MQTGTPTGTPQPFPCSRIGAIFTPESMTFAQLENDADRDKDTSAYPIPAVVFLNHVADLGEVCVHCK